jgi:hypothetical protein
MHRIRRSWTIATTSWQVLRAERGLLVLSVVAHALALVAAATVFFVGLAVAQTWAVVEAEAAGWVVVAVAFLVGGALVVVGQAAVVAGALQRMDGVEVGPASAVRGLRGRVGALLAWALIAIGVGRVLEAVRRRGGSAGSTAATGGRFAFRVASFLALPVIVAEGRGAVSALRRSWELLKRTWGENVTFNVGLKLLGALMLAPAVLGLVGADRVGLTPLPPTLASLGVAYVVLVVAGVSALSGVYKAALYRWSTGGDVDDAFDPGELEGAFGR